MKNLIPFLIFLLSLNLQAQKNTIEIAGKTNVNTFKCVNTNLPTPAIYVNSDNFSLPDFKVPTNSFDCGNKIMTSDFKTTLKGNQYPNIQIDFLSFGKKKTGKYGTWANVTLMNKVRKYYFEFTLSQNQLVGNRTIKFSDFGIEPPKKMGGMIRVDDVLNLQFKLKVIN